MSEGGGKATASLIFLLKLKIGDVFSEYSEVGYCCTASELFKIVLADLSKSVIHTKTAVKKLYKTCNSKYATAKPKRKFF